MSSDVAILFADANVETLEEAAKRYQAAAFGTRDLLPKQKIDSPSDDCRALVSILTKIAESFPERMEMRFRLVLLYMLLGRPDRAEAELTSIANYHFGGLHNSSVKINTGPWPNSSVVHWYLSDAVSIFSFPAKVFFRGAAEWLFNRWVRVLPLLVEYAREARDPRRFIKIDLSDTTSRMSVGFCASHNDAMLIPDHVFLGTKGYAGDQAHYKRRAIPWERRAKRVLWRGSDTGSVADWRNLPRLRLCECASQTALNGMEIFDIGLTSAKNLESMSRGESVRVTEGLIKPFFSHLQYDTVRYHIDMDGFSNAWSGLFRKLSSGSLVLKVDSGDGHQQWYYDQLRPWQNYIPISADLADLVDKVKWVESHDAEAADIAKAGKALATSLTYKSEIAKGVKAIDCAFRVWGE